MANRPGRWSRFFSRSTCRSNITAAKKLAGLENLEPRQLLAADPVISEFLALNTNTLQDEDNDFSDWIELTNRGDMVADLGGYYLTDDTGDLTKWEIPAGTNLNSDEYLIVFASGKDRTAGELHTNFTVDELGGDVLLVHPNGTTIISDYSDHPAMGENQSYGSFRPSGDAEYIGAGGSVRYLVPANNNLGTTWTTPEFNDASWSLGSDAIGFDTVQSADGFLVEMWDVANVNSLGQANSIIAGGNPDVSETRQVINFVDNSGGGNFANNTPFPGGVSGDDYVMRATTTVFVPADKAGIWTLGFNSDDGGRLRVDGQDVIVDDRNHAEEDLLGTVNLSAGTHDIEYIFWERGGGASAELFAATGQQNSFNGSFSLIGDPDGSLPLESLSNQIATDVGDDMFNTNASIYARYEFDATAADVTSLQLDTTYDDGLVVYLNGTEVYAANAPAVRNFNSTANSDQGISTEVVDLTAHVSALRDGNNVLAVHGLNAGASDAEFVLGVSLRGREFQTEELSLIDVASPGATNGVTIPVITEFQASNRSTIDDEDGSSSDWIEIFNPGLVDIELGGWFLTDNPLALQQWEFPTTRLAAGEYLVVFASSKDRAVAGEELHTNFQLRSEGEYLALVEPDGSTVAWEYSLNGQDYPQQFPDVSYGLRGDAIIDDGTVNTDTDPVRGLVAYWDFEEGSGTVANDVSGNGGTGTLVGTGAGDWVSGRNGNTTALNFDGDDNQVTTSLTASDLDFAGGTQRTVAGWVRTPAFFDGTNGGYFEIGAGAANVFSFRTISPLGTVLAVEHSEDPDLTTSVSGETWFHFAVTYDGVTVKLFIDGEQRSERLSPALDTNDLKTFTMGTYAGSFLNGQIDEIAVWDMDIGEESIAGLADETLTPLTVKTVNRLIGVDRNGFDVRQVNASDQFAGQIMGEVGGGANPLADVDLLLGLPDGHPGIDNQVAFFRQDINMADNAVVGDFGFFENDRAFPLDDFLGDDDHFAISANATLTIPEGAAGDFEFVVHSDEGVRLRIGGQDVIVDNSRHLASAQSGTVTLAEGDHPLELVYFEHTGAASLELSYASLNGDGEREADLALLTILPDQLVPQVAPNVFSADRVFFDQGQGTPGEANTFGVEIFLSPTVLSHAHGFYDDPFELTITNPRSNVDIYYTLDGTPPSEDNENALLYNGPITIDQTTTIRAVATLANAAPSDIVSTSYLFIDDIVTQSPNSQRPEGVPSNWNPGSTQSAWGMDPDIVNSPTWGPQMEAALKQIPTFSVILDLEDLFGASGIYTQASNRGRDWERPASVELIYPDGTGPDDGFTLDAGIRVRGGFSRSNNNPKHAFRFFFRAEYGETKLNYKLFEESGAESFDKIDLRSTQNYSWAFQNDGRNTYLRDIFSRDMQRAMGQPSTRGDYYHLYLNGIYWGVFQTQERPDDFFAASNYGGDDQDYDVFHNINPGGQGSGRSLGAIDGNLDAAERLFTEVTKPGGLGDANSDDYYRAQGMNPDGTRNPEYERLLDVDNLIDYMIITYYTSDADGPGSKFTRPGINNYFGFYNREDPDGMKFLEWDSEHSLDTGNAAGANYNMVDPFVNNGGTFSRFNGHYLHEQLAESNSDYRQRFIDRLTGYLQPGGLLSPENVRSMLQTRADEINLAMIAESARWGDSKRGTPFTQANWLTAVENLKNWTSNRSEHLLNQLRCAGSGSATQNPNSDTCNPRSTGWYPNFNFAAIEPAGGIVDEGTTVTLDVAVSEATDEDLASSSVVRWIAPGAEFEAIGLDWTDPDFSASTWKFGVGDVGYGAEFDDIIRSDVPTDVNSVYVRPFTTFRVTDRDGDGDLTDEFEKLTLGVRYDDGFIAYLNGQEIARANAPASPRFDSVATAEHTGSAEYENFTLDASAMDLLEPSGNVLAFHGLNFDGSDEFLIGWQLSGRLLGGETQIYFTTDGSDPRASGNAPSESAVLYDGTPIVVNENTLLRARTSDGTLWSAITEEFYQIVPSTLTITELNYNPYDPTEAELLEIPALDNDDFEFIEVENNGSLATNLAGLSFTNGVAFDFPSTSLAPGEKAVVVRNRDAFELRYGQGLNVLGTYNGSLNNGGERIILADGAGVPLLNFEYNDAAPWAQTADGDGASLELLDANAAADLHGKYYSWRGSVDFGGSPGTDGSDPIGVVVNEVLAHTDPPLTASDSIELLNTTSSAIDISGWYLSDAGGNPLKYQIPAGTILGPGEFVVFDESQFNPTPVNPADNDFALSGLNGDDVYLVVPDGAGGVQSFVDDVHFGASLNGVSFGRVPNGTGLLTPLGRSSLGCDNGAHRLSELLISEVNYNPELPNAAALAADPNVTSGDLEFIEIHNASTSALDLTDWRIRGGVDLNFDDGTMIDAGETVLLISFNPDNAANAARLAAFNAHYDINGVRLLGGYSGQLSGNGERVQLQRPDDPPVDDPDNIPHVSEDQILYDNLAPWAPSANGLGDSLQRNATTFYGNAVTSWTATTPTPGSVSFDGGIAGDFNGDGTIDATDIDMVNNAIQSGLSLGTLDLDGSGSLDIGDTEFLVTNILGTFMGDANLDGQVDSVDLNFVGLSWQQTGDCFTWSNGNFDGDQDIDVIDLNYVGLNWQNGVAAAAGVPRAPLALRAARLADVVIADDATELKRVDHSRNVVQQEQTSQRFIDRLARREIRRLDTFATRDASADSQHTDAVDELLADWDQ